MLRNPGLRKSVEQPVLDLNFAAAQIGSNAAPDSRIDFSRGTNAWFVDTDGLVKKSPHNLQVYSQDFDNAAWGKINTTVEANSIAAPDGTLTADKVVGTSANSYHTVTDGLTVVSGTQYWISIYIKAGSAGTEFSFVEGLSDGSLSVATIFDFGSETVLSTDANHNHVSVTDVGNGWYRFICSITPDATRTSNVYFGIADGTDATYDATGEFIYFWGAQVSQHTTLPVGNPYIKTDSSAVYAARLDHDASWFMSAAQEQNLFEYSEMLDDSYWTKDFSGAIANQAADPNGETTAEKLVEDNTASSQHRAKTGVNVTNGLNYTYSLYAKASERSEVRLSFFSTNSAFANTFAQFDLSDGSISSSNTDDATITDVGDGWFRLTATEQATATAEARIVVQIVKDGNVSYDGEGTATPVAGDPGIFVWGLQFEVGSTASTYHRTEGAPYYGPGATPKGLLIEEARTNLITDSEDFTAASWSSSGVTVTGNDVLAPDGTITGTKLVATASNAILSDSFTKAASAKTYTASLFAKTGDEQNLQLSIDDGGSTNRGRVNFDITDGSVSSTHNDGNFTNTSGSVEDFGNGWYRLRVTTTTNTGTSLRHRFFFSDFGTDTCFVWGAQLEEASFATSYIKTTGSTATRNADVATMGPTTGGTELVTNGTFDTDTTGWTGDDATLSVVSGKLRVTSTGGSYAQANQLLSTVVGRRYRLTADIDFGTSAGAHVQINAESDGSYTTNQTFTADGSASIDFTAQTTTPRIILHIGASTSAGVYQDFDNVSVRELYPFEQYNPAEGTMYSESESSAEVLNSCVFVITDRTERVELRHYGSSAGSSRAEIFIGSSQFTHSPTQSSDFRRNAIAYATNSAVAAGAGVAGTVDTSVAVPAADEILIGGSLFNIDYTGHIKRLSYYPRRLSDEAIENLTSD